jgi:hypothetical protein
MKIATASPRPNSCSPTIEPARPLEALRHRLGVREALVPELAHARDEEDLVVHREPEEHREEEDRDPRLDLVELVQPDEVGADPVLEDDHDHAVGGADCEQVQEHGLQGQEE